MKPNKRTETTMTDRRKWLKAWISLRNFDIGSRTNDFLFCYHCTNKALYSPELCWKLLQDMNDRLAEPLPLEELQKINEWNLTWLTNKKIIDKLGITLEEEELLRIGHNMKTAEERTKQLFAKYVRIREIEELYSQGKTAEEIAKKYPKISKRTVQRYIANYRAENQTEEERQKLADVILELYQQNTDLIQIARLCKCTVEYVRSALNLEGMTKITKQEIKRTVVEAGTFTTKEGKELYDCSLYSEEKTEDTLKEYDIAMAMLQTCQNNIAIFGTAGTGKSHLIHEFLRTLSPTERAATLIVAPTGRAADNLGGQTIHKTFHFPNEVQLNEDIASAPKELFSVHRIIVDEVNMVRQDVFSRMIKTIRFVEQQAGKKIQVIVLGDFGQIQPVATPADKELLSEFYPTAKGVYAFHSEQWEQMKFKKIVLKHIFRQNDPVFIEKLNQVKYGNVAALDWFHENAAVFPTVTGITICPTRKLVEHYNNEELCFYDPEDIVEFQATVSGKTNETYPCPELLRLAVGLRVMTLCNTEKYKNGNMGEIVKINQNSIQVRLNSGEIVTIGKRKFTLQDGVIFEQLPVILAYAITANKSEGMTFDEINIVPGYFDPGQLYTALSRCKSIKGIYIDGRLTAKDLRVDIEALKMTVDES